MTQAEPSGIVGPGGPSSELRSWMVRQIANLTGRPVDQVDDRATFASLGLESVAIPELTAKLEDELGLRVDVSMFYEHTTVAELETAVLLGQRSSDRTVPSPPPRDGVPEEEDVAIIGLSCRYPGADDPSHFWQLLCEGRDVVGEVPASRWDVDRYYSSSAHEPGRTVSRWGGFLADVDHFDAPYFSLTPFEAERIDPQHRLLLELAVEAIEDAGESTQRIEGSRTGVFIGISSSDYAIRLFSDPSTVDGLMAMGSALSVAANRISYTFGLRGPSLSVDTACSSSLVAVHQARCALLRGECDRAIVGGVNLVLEPNLTVALGQAGMLSPDGRCHAFDARANGYVRSEGAGVVILKRLSDAERSRDRSYAVIRSSAVNHGGASNGLTAPNPLAQREVLGEAYAGAGVDPGQVQYVECHGTGTFLGDPIEADALGAVVGRSRQEPCLIGSVKSNLGHLEAAAGITGLIKTALALHHGALPPSIHFETPNPHIAFDDLGLEVVTELRHWNVPQKERLAGVSSFGFGGTNAHAVLGGVAAPDDRDGRDDGPYLVPIADRNESLLSARLERWADELSSGSLPIDDRTAWTASMRRDHGPARFAAVGRSADEIAEAIRNRNATIADEKRDQPPSIGFCFSGQGAQHPGMAKGLLQRRAFADAVTEVDALVRAEAGWSVRELLSDVAKADLLEQTRFAQPALVAVQVGLLNLWASIGVRPDAVVGHSLGELTAAYAAGAFDLEQLVRLVVRRAEAMNDAPAGAMLATDLTVDEASALVDRQDGLSLAAVNNAETIVLAGSPGRLADVAAGLASEGRFAVTLDTAYAFHSADMDEAAASMLADLPGHRPFHTPMFSTVTGSRLLQFGERHWFRNVRDTVRFGPAVGAVVAHGVDILLEIGPSAALRSSLRRVAGTYDRRVVVLATLANSEDESASFLRAAADLFEQGVDLRWRGLHDRPGQVVRLPVRQWRGRRHWIEAGAPAGSHSPDDSQGFYLGSELSVAGHKGRIHQQDLGPVDLELLADHRLGSSPVMPVTAYIGWAVEAARSAGILGHVEISSMSVHQPLFLPEDGVQLQTTLEPGPEGRFGVSMHSRAADGTWSLHAQAHVGACTGGTPDELPPRRSSAALPVDVSLLYVGLSELGLDYGPTFRSVRQAWASEAKAWGVVGSGPSRRFGDVDPRTLDGALHLVAVALPDLFAEARLAIPVGAETIRLHGPIGGDAEVELVVQDVGGDGRVIVDVVLHDDQTVLAEIDGLVLQELGGQLAAAAEVDVECYQTVWRAEPQSDVLDRPGGDCLLVGFDTDLLTAVERGLLEAGIGVTSARLGRSDGSEGKSERLIDPADGGAFDSLLAQLALSDPPVRFVVALVGGTDPASSDAAMATMSLVQAISFAPTAVTPELMVVTTGASSIKGEPVADLAGAAAAGLVRVLPFENNVLRHRSVDVVAADAAATTTMVLQELAVPISDTRVAYRGRERYVSRLIATPAPALRRLQVRDGVNYVVVGGTGGIGVALAERLLDRGASAVSLVARNRPSSIALERLERTAGDAARVDAYQADVADSDALEAALTSIRGVAPIGGIIHAAGELADGPLLQMSSAELDRVLRAKVAGAWNCHELTECDELDWFVLFSSAASVLGSPGQANYCAANAYLDALAELRRAHAKPSISINWGPWVDTGMAAEGGGSKSERQLSTSVANIDVGTALDAFESILEGADGSVVVLGVDLIDLLQYYPPGPAFSFFSELHSGLEHERSHGSAAPSRGSAGRRSAHVEPVGDVERRIATLWQTSLGVESVGVDDSFFELGGDSVFANQILVQISSLFGVAVDSEAAFKDFSVRNLAKLVDAELEAKVAELTDAEAEELLRRLDAASE